MEITKTSIEGLMIITPTVYADDRGYFMESFQEIFINQNFHPIKFIQDNESKSYYGVLRGLHFQQPPFEQTKLVRVIKGKILDVAVDLRKCSPTFGRYEKVILSDENKKQFFIPKGFAHGFVVLSEEAIVSYKVDNIYEPNYDSGIHYEDIDLNIDWEISKNEIKVSPKDSMQPSFLEFCDRFKNK